MPDTVVTVKQDSTLILIMTNAIHAQLNKEFPEADDATKIAACAATGGVYQQALMRDNLVATMVKMLGNL